jgi:hypothetical protein
MTAQDPDRLSFSGHTCLKTLATSPQTSFKPSQAGGLHFGSGIIDSTKSAQTDLRTVQLRRVIEGDCMDEQMLTGQVPSMAPSLPALEVESNST